MAEQNIPFKRLNVVLCDEIRTEDNGKHILIGVYSSDIVVATLPQTVALSVWLQAETLKAGAFTIEARFVDENDNPLATLGMEGEAHKAYAVSALAFPRIPIPLKSAGLLKVQWKIGQGDWQTLLSLQVLTRPAPQP